MIYCGLIPSFSVCKNCPKSKDLRFCLQQTNNYGADYHLFMYNSLNWYGSLSSLVETIAFTTAFWFVGRCHRLGGIETLFLLDEVARMKKSIWYFSGLLLLYFLTELWFDLLGMPFSSKCITLPGMNVQAGLRYFIVFHIWWHVSYSLPLLHLGWNVAHIWISLEFDITS